MSKEQPRKAYCNGCEVTFAKMHMLRNHRRSHACGGRFLPIQERIKIDAVRRNREADQRAARYALEDAKHAEWLGKRRDARFVAYDPSSVKDFLDEYVQQAAE